MVRGPVRSIDSIAVANELRTQLALKMLSFMGIVLDDAEFNKLVDEVSSVFPKCLRLHIANSLVAFAGTSRVFTRENSDTLAYRLSGNASALKHRSVLGVTSSQDDWCGAEVQVVEHRPKHPCYVFGCRMVTGAGAGKDAIWKTDYPKSFLKTLGFGRRRFDAPASYAMSCWLLVKPIESPFDTYFKEAKLNAECEKHNKALVQARFGPCPKGSRVSCASCFFGREQCPAAIRRITKQSTKATPSES